jgi:general secretion pathway protein G
MSRQRRLRRRIRQAGMTLVEIMIVVIIMAMIAAAAGAAVLPQWRRAQLNQANTDAQAIRAGATNWIMQNNNECPTVEQLRAEGMLDRAGHETDPWDGHFAIECQGDEVIVSSPGPNGQPGDEDDIRAGQPQS